MSHQHNFILFFCLPILFVAIFDTFFKIWLHNTKPKYIGFKAFRFICGLGKKVKISDLPTEMARALNILPLDIGFQKWQIEIIRRGKISKMEFFAINRQVLLEIGKEIEKIKVKR